MRFNGNTVIKCKNNKKNLKEYPSGIHIGKDSHWASLYHFIAVYFSQFLNRRVFFWTFNKKMKATLTIEAAFVLPMFILTMYTLVGMFDCYRLQSIVKTSMHQSAMELGMYAYVEDSYSSELDAVNSALCIAYAKRRLPKFEDNVSVSMAGSCYKDNKVTLVARIKYSFPIALIPIPPITLTNISEVYSWVGNQNNTQENESKEPVYKMVYVTKNGSVYHTSSECSHINRKIYKSEKIKLDESYDACEKCCQNQAAENTQTIYYTENGECYHIKKDCSSLKRFVRLVEFSTVKNLSLCERCEKEGKS